MRKKRNSFTSASVMCGGKFKESMNDEYTQNICVKIPTIQKITLTNKEKTAATKYSCIK